MPRLLFLVFFLAGAQLSAQAPAQRPDPLAEAYDALRERQYQKAISLFEEALRQAPDRATVRKDLAYTLLKAGEREAARDQFAEAMRLDPDDLHTALEYAFLCHETGKTAEARRIFDRVRNTATDAQIRSTAQTAFDNVDRPLREGIERWTHALAANPDDFNAHRELAQLAEARGDLELAAQHYLYAWRLRRSQKSLLVDYGRAAFATGQAEPARAAWVAAMWGGEPRAAEAARKLFGPRYPYVYEFRQALELDPENAALRKELAYLLAAMGREQEAQNELAKLAEVGETGAGIAQPARRSSQIRELAMKSYQAGYLKDALKYSLAAQEEDPLDFEVILQLGWTYNLLGQDDQAIRWFRLASKSPNPSIAAQAGRAYRALRPSQARVRVSAWMFPVYSSRWQDVFGYGQWKTEWKLGALPARLYFSTRMVGNGRELSAGPPPHQLLSESALIPAVGMSTSYWHGAMLWAEAGVAAKYRGETRGLPRRRPDFRGGLAFSKGFGRLLGATQSGPYVETSTDAVFLSQFDRDVVLYYQNRAGFTVRPWKALGGLQTQWFLATHLITDSRRQTWANAVEAGPGVRFRWSRMPPNWLFSVNWIRGRYQLMENNPNERMYNDLRVGFWCSFLR
jgi:Tfp pilus assembly protein PilF